MRIAIVIPTFNRVDKLKRALDAINQICSAKNISIVICISNTQSTDETESFLDQLILKHETYINNMKRTHLQNWVALSKIVPQDVDWVWLHGDDDIIFEKKAIKLIAKIIKKYDVDLISIPQAKRSRNSGKIFTGSIYELCNMIGYHELLGWMSQLCMKSELYFSMMKKYQKMFYKPMSAKLVHKYKIGNFPHSYILLSNFFNRKALFWDSHIIDEQINSPNKLLIERSKRLKQEFNEKFLYSDRFFFDAAWISEFCNLNQLKLENEFLRYVNRPFWLLLLDIIYEQSQTTSKNELGAVSIQNKIRIIHDLISNLKDQNTRIALEILLHNMKIIPIFKDILKNRRIRVGDLEHISKILQLETKKNIYNFNTI